MFDSKQFQAAKNIDELNKLLAQQLTAWNISTFAFTYYAHHPLSSNKLKYEYCSRNFKIWHEHYIAEDYEEIDSTMTTVYRSNIPIAWDLQNQLAMAKSERERQMRLDSMKFGAEKGLCIPIHGCDDDFAILLIVQMKGEQTLDENPTIAEQLLLLGHYYFHSLQALLISNQITAQEKYQLSSREMQCLTLLAKKHSVQDIANILNITPRTVNFHIQRINKKLGTKNKYQSVEKALAKKLLVL